MRAGVRPRPSGARPDEHGGARQPHDRRRGRPGAQGDWPRGGGPRRGHRDPRLLLRAAPRAAGRRLPHVPLRGAAGPAEAAGGLHPDRAPTSTTDRLEGWPWENQNVPTVCGMCPVGCNIDATTREGKVKRILSRNHHEVDQGWLCDKGRFAFTHLRADDRLTDPLLRVRRRGLEEISWERALDEAERLLRDADGRIVTALSGSETVEQAYALAKLLRRGLRSHAAVLPEEVSDALDEVRLPLSAIRDADVVAVLGDAPVVERAPIVERWIKEARRKGARILYELDEDAVREAENAILIWSGWGGQGGERVAALARRLGAAGAFFLPETANGRGVCDAWAAAADEDPVQPERV